MKFQSKAVIVKIPKGHDLVGVKVPVHADFYKNQSVPVSGLIVMKHMD